MSFSHIKRTDQSAESACGGVFLNNIATPCVIVSTYIGNPSYTTPDVLDESQAAYLGQLEIADVWQKDSKTIPLTDLRKEIKNSTAILSSRNMVTPNAACDANGISINTFGGRHHISVKDYVSRLALDKPKVVIAIADECNIASGRKRLTKSIERTSQWFHAMMAAPELKTAAERPFVFGVGVAIPEIPTHIEKYCKDLLALGANGITVGGAHMGESEEQRVVVMNGIRSAVGPNVPVLIQGADSIRDILLSITHGVDLVSTNYPSIVTAKGYAISLGARRVLRTDVAVAVCEASNDRKRETPAAEDSDAPAAKRIRLDKVNTEHAEGAAVVSAITTAEPELNRNKVRPPKHNQKANSHNTSKNNVNQHKPIAQCDAASDAKIEQCVVDLWDKDYCKDTQPLVVGCQCHACKHHTRAYIHHLLIAKEMLAEVLLYHHNQHQVMRLFEDARRHIAEGTFSEWSSALLKTLK